MGQVRVAKITVGLFAVVSLLASLVTTAVGVQDTSVSSAAAQGIELSPALVELNAAHGKTYTITIKVTNVTASDLTYNTSVDDFNAANETGSPHIITDSNLPTSASMKTWVAAIPQFSLKSRQSTVITGHISIPANAEPGGHYGVLRFSGRAPELKDTGVGLSASAGVLLLVRVDGAINEKASLASFFNAQNGKQSFFFETPPVSFVTRIKNEGNIHVKPSGSVELRDMFGGLVKIMPVNEEKSNVLPDSIRRFETQYSGDWMIGRYTANLTLGYGTTGQAITSSISFWVIPYKVILAILLVLATIVFILSRMIKVYNRNIIAKSKNEGKTKKKKRTNEKR